LEGKVGKKGGACVSIFTYCESAFTFRMGVGGEKKKKTEGEGRER